MFKTKTEIVGQICTPGRHNKPTPLLREYYYPVEVQIVKVKSPFKAAYYTLRCGAARHRDQSSESKRCLLIDSDGSKVWEIDRVIDTCCDSFLDIKVSEKTLAWQTAKRHLDNFHANSRPGGRMDILTGL